MGKIRKRRGNGDARASAIRCASHNLRLFAQNNTLHMRARLDFTSSMRKCAEKKENEKHELEEWEQEEQDQQDEHRQQDQDQLGEHDD